MIHILDQHSANQIAAGEVVERPASVVKELVENALDAGAKHIDVTIEGNGVPLIRVRDDGCGISATDLPLAAIRHATSKINHIEDLDYLQTLGFRGEALPSIASVSKMEITSRPVNEIAGLCLTLGGGEHESLKEVGSPVGTSVTVRNLFFNTPARLKFLKSTSTEFGVISDMIGRIALAHPDVSFSLAHPHQVVLQTSGRGDLRETIGSILGHTIARQLIPFEAKHEEWMLHGFISPPDIVRTSKQAQNFMVNGRIVRSSILSRALEEGYHTLIPNKLHPVVVLHLTVPPSEYDVNVHPTKMDVRFKNEQALVEFIRKNVYESLIRSKPLPTFQRDINSRSIPIQSPRTFSSTQSTPPSSKSNVYIPSHSFKQMYETEMKSRLATGSLNKEQPQPLQIYKQQDFLLPIDDSSVQVNDQEATVMNQKPSCEYNKLKVSLDDSVEECTSTQTGYDVPIVDTQATRIDEVADGSSLKDDILKHIWPLAQIFNTYILATDSKILLLIDQHAAHERVNYEKLLNEFKMAKQASQALLIPLPMELTLQEEQVILEHLWTLNEMGFILEQFGTQTYLLRSVPALTEPYQADKLLRQFIDEVLQKNSTPSFDYLLEEWIYLLACKQSIKAQATLSILEMEQLISQLSKTQNPYTCPHGRPTMVKMTQAELERRFYRT